MPDRAARDIRIERVRVGQPTKDVGNEFGENLAVRADAVERLLKAAPVNLAAPHSCAANLTSLADEYVPRQEPELLGLGFAEVHGQQVIGVDATPLDILVAEIGPRPN